MRGVVAGGVAVALALAAAGAAGPAASPSFSLELAGTAPGAAGVVRLGLRLASGGAPAPVYVPAGWGVDMRRAAGSVVARGSVTAAGPEAGALRAGDAEVAGCPRAAGSARWAWTGAAGLVVDVSETAGAERGLGAYRLDVCSSRAATLRLAFVRGVLANPATVGLYKWRALVTPSRELQSQVPVPHVLSLRASRSGGRLAVRGRLLIEGLREEGARVVVSGGRTRGAAAARVLGIARTGGSGRFVLRATARGVRWVSARTLPRPAKCARPVAPRCSGVVAPALAAATAVRAA